MIRTVLAFIFLAGFLLCAAVHLVRCWQGSPKSARTKPALVSLLTLCVVFAVPQPQPVLIAALAASWLGDVLLMPKGEKWFVAGGVSFLLSHLLFILVYLPYIRWAPSLCFAAVPAFAVYLGVSAAVMRAIRANAPKAMRVPLFLYLAANSVMNVFALMMLCVAPSPGRALAFTGAVLFFASDCILFLSRYWDQKDRVPKRGFLIMLTYISGEALIAFGVLSAGNLPLFGRGG